MLFVVFVRDRVKERNTNEDVCVMSQVEEQIRTLQECYKNKPEEEEENEGAGASMKDMMDAEWQTLLQRFFTLQDLANNFINSSNMVGHFGGFYNASETTDERKPVEES